MKLGLIERLLIRIDIININTMEIINSSSGSDRITLGNWKKINDLIYSTQPVDNIRDIYSLMTDMLCKSILSMNSSIFNFIDFTSANHYDQKLRYIILEYLSKYGNDKVMDWLLTTEFIIICNNSILYSAIINKNLGILIWYHKHFRSEIHSLIIEIINSATAHGNIDIFDWINLKVVDIECDMDSLDLAVKNGHLNVLKWFHKHNKLDYSHRTIDYAAKYNHINILEWLYDECLLKYSDAALDGAAENGHFAVLEWFIEKGLKLKYTQRTINKVLKCDRLDIYDKITKTKPDLWQLHLAVETASRNSDYKTMEKMMSHTWTSTVSS